MGGRPVVAMLRKQNERTAATMMEIPGTINQNQSNIDMCANGGCSRSTAGNILNTLRSLSNGNLCELDAECDGIVDGDAVCGGGSGIQDTLRNLSSGNLSSLD